MPNEDKTKIVILKMSTRIFCSFTVIPSVLLLILSSSADASSFNNPSNANAVIATASMLSNSKNSTSISAKTSSPVLGDVKKKKKTKKKAKRPIEQALLTEEEVEKEPQHSDTLITGEVAANNYIEIDGMGEEILNTDLFDNITKKSAFTPVENEEMLASSSNKESLETSYDIKPNIDSVDSISHDENNRQSVDPETTTSRITEDDEEVTGTSDERTQKIGSHNIPPLVDSDTNETLTEAAGSSPVKNITTLMTSAAMNSDLPSPTIALKSKKKKRKRIGQHYSEVQPHTSDNIRQDDPTAEKKDSFQVSCLTWNLCEESPTNVDFLKLFEMSDFICISAQECENIKPRRSEGSRSRLFRKLCIQQLDRLGFVPIAIHSLGGIQLLLFVHSQFLGEVSSVKLADVACGIGNTFHNKGAIGAFVSLRRKASKTDKKTRKRDRSLSVDSNVDHGTTKLLFVSAHLEAHVNNVQGRNDNFWRIITEFESQAPAGFIAEKEEQTTNRVQNRAPKSNKSIDAYSKSKDNYKTLHHAILREIDHIFFCGDLNYRLDLPRESVEHHIDLQQQQQAKNWIPLLRHDQLLASIAHLKAFPFFSEGKISFPPTFKYDKNSDKYDTSPKQRIPAWTDRILFQSKTSVKVLAYNSVADATHSDHRPVYGTFLVKKKSEAVAKPQT